MLKKENRKNVWLLGFSSLFNDIGSETITPILPFYIQSLGGGGASVGLISGLREGLSSLLKLLGGWASDKLGKRRVFVFFGYLFSIIFRFLIGIANTWQSLIAFVSLERFGKIRDAPRDAIIADSVNEKGRNFGLHQMLDSLGGVLGTLLVLVLFWKFNLDFKRIVLIAVIISVLSLLPLFFVKHTDVKKQKKTLVYNIKHLDRKIKYFIFVTAVFSLANFGLYMFLLLKVKEVSGSIIIALLTYLAFHLIYSVFSEPLGMLSDKIGRKKVLLFGYSLFSLICLSFIFSSSLLSIIFLFIIYGLVFAVSEPIQKAYISDYSKETKATALGFYYFIRGIAIILGGIIAGLLWDINQKIMFTYLSCIGIFSLCLLLFVIEKKLISKNSWRITNLYEFYKQKVISFLP